MEVSTSKESEVAGRMPERIPVPRGTCRVCLRRHPLRLDGSMQRHTHYLFECGGSGFLPVEDPRPGPAPNDNT